VFETKLTIEDRIARTRAQLKKAKDSRRRASIRAVKLEAKLHRLVAQQLTQIQATTETAMNQPKPDAAIPEAAAPPPGAKVQRPPARSRQSPN
jgi:hypothetical protein